MKYVTLLLFVFLSINAFCSSETNTDRQTSMMLPSALTINVSPPLTIVQGSKALTSLDLTNTGFKKWAPKPTTSSTQHEAPPRKYIRPTDKAIGDNINRGMAFLDSITKDPNSRLLIAIAMAKLPEPPSDATVFAILTEGFFIPIEFAKLMNCILKSFPRTHAYFDQGSHSQEDKMFTKGADLLMELPGTHNHRLFRAVAMTNLKECPKDSVIFAVLAGAFGVQEHVANKMLLLLNILRKRSAATGK